MPKVSVIVPIYNAAQYLEQCLDSIVNQTLKDIEIILINDGSTDNSAEICEKYYSSDERVVYISKENAGAVMARKDGIAAAEGEYIGFVDSDDWLELNMFEVMYNSGKEYDADIVFCNCIENESDHYYSPEIPSGFYDKKGISEKILPLSLAYISKNGEKRSIRWANWLRIFKREIITGDNIKYNTRIRRCEDLILTYEATIKANSLLYLGDQYLYHYHVVQNSKSRRYTKNAWEAFKSLILHLYEDTKQLDDEVMMKQMHLRAFFSVTDCIENELKFIKQNKINGIREIRRVMDDEICDEFYGKIDIGKMNRKFRTWYKLIHRKHPILLVIYDKQYKIDEWILRKLVKPFIGFVTENRVTGSIYKKIRKR